MNEPLIRECYRDEGLLVVNKPAGLVCHPTKGDERSSLIGRLRLHLGSTTGIHMINRLDRETSGLVAVSTNDERARALRKLWSDHSVRKEYLAISHGHPDEPDFVINAPIGRDEKAEVHIRSCIRSDGNPSETRFIVHSRFEREGKPFSLMKVYPKTGRTHQIRVHLEYAGLPIVGDKIYGGNERFYLDFIAGRLSPAQKDCLILPWQALHACRLEFSDSGQTHRFRAEAEAWFRDFAAEAYPNS